jgi:hypothetical protein
MDRGWTKGLKNSPFQERGASATRETSDVQLPVDIVIGVDYGTRFTKIAVGTGRERRVWEDERGKRLIPSVLYVASDGTVVSYPDRPSSPSDKIEYLKMLLVERSDDVFTSVRPRVNGKPMKEAVRPLTAAFLAGLVQSVRASVLRQQPHLARRRINWFINVGAPVQHCDSHPHAFKEVAAVAFHWASQDGPTKIKLNELCEVYKDTARSLDVNSSPATVMPELTAALHEFVRDPNRADDLYGFFDIGGGTIDGAIFRINRSGAGFPLRIHAARVDHAGSMAVSRTMLAEMYSRLSHYIESPLLGQQHLPNIVIPLSEPLVFRDNRSARDEIQNLVATVIGKARRHLYGQMFSPRVDATASDTRPLRVFLAGGGASSAWYKAAIGQTFSDRNLHQWGLTGIRSEIVAKPPDYQGNDFPRFVTALGLADATPALSDAQLPSQMQDADPLPTRAMPTLITKDLV